MWTGVFTLHGGHPGNVVSGNRLRVRLPCPPLRFVNTNFSPPHAETKRNGRTATEDFMGGGMQPHWLDKVIGPAVKRDSANDTALALAHCQQIQRAIEAALAEPDPQGTGGDKTQSVRAAICAVIADHNA